MKSSPRRLCPHLYGIVVPIEKNKLAYIFFNRSVLKYVFKKLDQYWSMC